MKFTLSAPPSFSSIRGRRTVIVAEIWPNASDIPLDVTMDLRDWLEKVKRLERVGPFGSLLFLQEGEIMYNGFEKSCPISKSNQSP
ncbi:hypothetical protein EU538_11730 [Candidatus Thorarchaeota archaeon]|nr:MAG: hypothetical protein EU538_11730 [Candidatus Thorarchaeota archaeon]